MKTLFALELKKLTKKRMNIIVITVCLILAGILFYLPVSQFIVLDTDGKQTSGMEAIAMDKEFSNSNAGKLTNEKIKARNIRLSLMIRRMFPKTLRKNH